MITLPENSSNPDVINLPDGIRQFKWLMMMRLIMQPIETLKELEQRYGDIYTSIREGLD